MSRRRRSINMPEDTSKRIALACDYLGLRSQEQFIQRAVVILLASTYESMLAEMTR
jgi:hypothetical protein